MSQIKKIQKLMGISESEITKKSLIREYDEVRDTLSSIMPTLGPIPKTKKISTEVIRKVLVSVYGSDNIFNLGKDVRLDEIPTLKDRIRFYEFYLSFGSDFEGRGFNFEGLLAGLFGGEVISGTKQKEDIFIDGKYYSVKLSQSGERRYDLGTFKVPFEVVLNIMNKRGVNIKNIQSPLDLMKMGDDYTQYKKMMLNNTFKSSFDPGDDINWIFAMLSTDFTITYNVYSSSELIEMLLNPDNVTSGKQSGGMSIGIYQDVVLNRNSPKIIFPKVSKKELESTLYRSENQRMEDKISDLFGPYGKKIRFDVLNYIRKNPELFLQRVIDLYGDRLREMLDNRK